MRRLPVLSGLARLASRLARKYHPVRLELACAVVDPAALDAEHAREGGCVNESRRRLLAQPLRYAVGDRIGELFDASRRPSTMVAGYWRPPCSAFRGWRDPDSNRGHHDFQAAATARTTGAVCRGLPELKGADDKGGFQVIPGPLGHRAGGGDPIVTRRVAT